MISRTNDFPYILESILFDTPNTNESRIEVLYKKYAYSHHPSLWGCGTWGKA